MPAEPRRGEGRRPVPTKRVVASGRSSERAPSVARNGSVKKVEPVRRTRDEVPPVHRPGWLRRHAKGVAFLLLAPPIVLLGAILWYARGVPLPPDEVSAQTTFVYDSKGDTLASFNAGEDRTAVVLSRVPKVTIDAVLASEDHNFYQHGGLDPLGVARALFADIRSRGSLQGGSTITQQYVKVTYLGQERTLKRKLREAVLSVKLERRLTKDQILERYLNAVYFGRGSYGIQAASQAYFGVDVDQLDLAESAYLAGLLRAPERADARRNPALALSRRRSVLDSMLRFGMISRAQHDDAALVPLTGEGGTVRARKGPTSTYEVRGAGAEFAVDMVRRELVARFGAARVFGGGLRVHTSIDLSMQRLAHQVLFDQVLNRPGDPDAAMVVLDHEGRVLALVGGRDWSVSQVNLAVGRGFGGVGRQGGSTFKPFVLAAALREGIAVSTTFSGPQHVTIAGAGQDGSDWDVSNYDDEAFDSPITLTKATALSVNTVYAQLVTDPKVGPERVVQMAHDLGVTSPLDPYPAIALGAEEVGPLEMADAYLTFARGGTQVTPSVITEVTDVTGQRLFRPERTSGTRVLTTDQAAAINGVLGDVVAHGTGVGARLGDGRQVAGKTGTTQNARDAWFVGYTPKDCCVVAVWMGYAQTNRPMTKVHGRRVSGGAFPATIFKKFMDAAVVGAGADTGTFAAPSDTAPPPAPRRGTRVTVDSKVSDSVPDSAVGVAQPPVTGVQVPGGQVQSPVDTAPASAPTPVEAKGGATVEVSDTLAGSPSG